MNNLTQFKKDFKRDVLINVVVDLKHDKTTNARAKSLAREVIAIFEEEEARTVFRKINKLAENHPDVLNIFIKRAQEYEIRQKEENLNQVRIYLKGGVN